MTIRRVTLTTPLPPTVNHQYQHFGRMKLTEAALAYRSAAGWQAREAILPDEPLTGSLAVTITFYAERGDIDGRIKSLMDAMNGTLWGDDRQVAELHVYQRRPEAGSEARAEIDVRVLP